MTVPETLQSQALLEKLMQIAGTTLRLWPELVK
jgi:uncharacterized protein HemX